MLRISPHRLSSPRLPPRPARPRYRRSPVDPCRAIAMIPGKTGRAAASVSLEGSPGEIQIDVTVVAEVRAGATDVIAWSDHDLRTAVDRVL